MSKASEVIQTTTKPRITLPILGWLGGAFYVGNQPGCGFWDGVVWMWYIGRFIAAHFALLPGVSQ